MDIKLKNTGSSAAMERHYQRLIEAGWGPLLHKETRTIKGFRRGWDIEETDYTIDAEPKSMWTFLFDLSEALKQELIIYKEDGRPVIEIYDDWRE